MKSKALILNHEQVKQKLQRIAWQIYEAHSHEKELVLIGIKEAGDTIAVMLIEELKKISKLHLFHASVILDKSARLPGNAEIINPEPVAEKPVVLIDDVANSGKTLLMAMLPVASLNPKSITTVVLANRSHYKFPVSANIVGISLSTTLHEHIQFKMDENKVMQVWID